MSEQLKTNPPSEYGSGQPGFRGPRYSRSDTPRGATVRAGGDSGSAPPATAPAQLVRTVQPTKLHIRCYECGYEFNLSGRMHSTYCPKCRVTLDLAGYTIDAACSETLKTLGKIKVTSRGIVTGAKFVATDIELYGKVSSSSLEAFETLVIFPGAEFDRKDIISQDLRIEPGAALVFNTDAVYRNVELAGSLEAPLYATGLVTIHAGAQFKGSIAGPRLIVEDGAALNTDLSIGPRGAEQAGRKLEMAKTLRWSTPSERVVAQVIQAPGAEAGTEAAAPESLSVSEEPPAG